MSAPPTNAPARRRCRRRSSSAGGNSLAPAATAWALIGLNLPLAPAASQLPTGPVQRTGYECQIVEHFVIKDRYGRLPQFKDLTRPKVAPQAWSADATGGPEIIEAQASVERDGRISRLHIVWLQAGTMGFPYAARADLDGIVMKFDYEWREPANNAASLPPFDPDRVLVTISVQEQKKIKQPLTLRLNRYPFDTTQLGGLAAIPPWRHSASITLPWPTLRTFANGELDVNFELASVAVLDRQGLTEKPVRSGRLDLHPVAAVLDQFVTMDTAIRARAANAASQCLAIESNDFDI